MTSRFRGVGPSIGEAGTSGDSEPWGGTKRRLPCGAPRPAVRKYRLQRPGRQVLSEASSLENPPELGGQLLSALLGIGWVGKVRGDPVDLVAHVDNPGGPDRADADPSRERVADVLGPVG